MKTHKMTKWDIGRVLIMAQESLLECVKDLREPHPEFAKMLLDMALTVGDKFNAFGSHSFGIGAHKQESSSESVTAQRQEDKKS